MKKKVKMVEESAVPYGAFNQYSVSNLISTIRSGISYSIFSNLFTGFPFSQADWSWFLGISERTLLRYRTEKKTFDKLQSEKIINIYLLYKRSEGLFGSAENFNIWLNTSNVALGGELPKKMLDNNFGITFINDLLTRIEHGISA